MEVPRLRQVREGKLLTQQELARKAQMSVTTISFAERGIRDVRISSVRRLAEALGVPAAELLGRDDTLDGAAPVQEGAGR